jgi:hypothetical protein
MPRIRNWKDLVLYRRQQGKQHVDKLFKATIDWVLIEQHWQELMQVALSIQAGTISSPLLLRRLGSESRKNRLPGRRASSATLFARCSCSSGSAASNCGRRSPRTRTRSSLTTASPSGCRSAVT